MTYSKRIAAAEREVCAELEHLGAESIQRSPGYAAERIVCGLIQLGVIPDGVEGEPWPPNYDNTTKEED